MARRARAVVVVVVVASREMGRAARQSVCAVVGETGEIVSANYASVVRVIYCMFVTFYVFARTQENRISRVFCMRRRYERSKRWKVGTDIYDWLMIGT